MEETVLDDLTSVSHNKLKGWPFEESRRPLLIAGPCSAETEEQVLSTARKVADAGAQMLRAGIWKPRTRPGSFEGVGDVGLQWLQKAREETGLPITTEVANAGHVESCLKAGIDVLWVGARTTANPFAVQELAEALKGVDVPVLVKNPVNPDIGLWIGALERLNRMGVSRLGAIHRGVSRFHKSNYRNAPEWQMPIELRKSWPEILLINDPSHIAGKRELLAPIAQKAMDLDFDGLMVETHIDPQNAWSDADQQVTPKGLCELIDGLVIRRVQYGEDSQLPLEDLRQRIDDLDGRLMYLLRQRMEVIHEIGKYKKGHGMTILQQKRWEQLLDLNLKRGLDLDLSDEFTRNLFKAIHQESINKQADIFNKES